MRSTPLCVFFFGFLAVASAQPWEVIKQKHFLVYYKADKNFARRVGRAAEDEYERIAHAIGYTRHGDFWLWDNRARIFVYPNAKSFRRSTGAPKWAAGKANYEQKEIATFNGSLTFFESVLPHELAHLVFRDFVGFRGDVPLWLDEGVAQWAERKKRAMSETVVIGQFKREQLIPLETLTSLDVRSLQQTGAAILFYSQAANLVGFMIEKHGPERFRVFCGHLRDGKTMNDALRFTYPSRMRNLEELEAAWKSHLGSENRK